MVDENLNTRNSSIQPRLGILGALPAEINKVSELLTEINDVELSTGTYRVARLHDVPIVLCLSGMGKVNAALTTQRLLSDFDVKLVVFTGVAGGLSPHVHIGDILFAEKVFQHDFGYLSGHNGFAMRRPGILPELGLGDENHTHEYLLEEWPHKSPEEVRSWLLKILQNSEEQLYALPVDQSQHKPKIISGVVATGDQFIACPNKKNELILQKAEAVEMEGGAVAQVCHQNNTPWMLLRTISDNASETSHVDFVKFFPKVASNNAILLSALLQHDEFKRYLSGHLGISASAG